MTLDPERALQVALIDHLRADAGVGAVLGHPAAIYDEPPPDPGWPHLLIGRCESRPYAADGGATEHILTLTARSRFGGTEEAKAVNAAVRTALTEAAIVTAGHRIVNLRVTYQDVFRAADWQKTLGVTRLRAVTEPE
jgi:hypothetical protein